MDGISVESSGVDFPTYGKRKRTNQSVSSANGNHKSKKICATSQYNDGTRQSSASHHVSADTSRSHQQMYGSLVPTANRAGDVAYPNPAAYAAPPYNGMHNPLLRRGVVQQSTSQPVNGVHAGLFFSPRSVPLPYSNQQSSQDEPLGERVNAFRAQ